MLVADSEWYLYSGASSKGQMLKKQVERLGLSVGVGQEKPVGIIDEKNHFKSSRHLYSDKAEQIWVGARRGLGDRLGITNDVHPKKKKRHDTQYLSAMVKYCDTPGDTPIVELPYDQRLALLADYVAEQFATYQKNEAIDVRLSSGVVPFVVHAMLGLIIEKIYIRYQTPPIIGRDEAIDYLLYARVNNTDSNGEPDNQGLIVSAKAAGGILHKTLLEWYLKNKGGNVLVDCYENRDPLAQIDEIGSGFTTAMVATIAGLAQCSHNAPKETRQKLVHDPIPLLPKQTFELTWGCGVVWQKV